MSNNISLLVVMAWCITDDIKFDLLVKDTLLSSLSNNLLVFVMTMTNPVTETTLSELPGSQVLQHDGCGEDFVLSFRRT